ncbi:MAG: phytanoyl-CoA dioxygenase family protein [Planctomycetota bacterium]|nr:phytanoyl-CoA dioxygenase family protein [Planctomycetota bacterium]
MSAQTATVFSAEDRIAYDRDGFLLKRGLLPQDWMRAIDEETQALHEEMARAVPEGAGVTWDKQVPGRPKRIRQLMNSELVCPTLMKAIHSDFVLDVIEGLIGPDITLFHSKLLMKAARDGTITPWHQDFGYWRHGHAAPVQVNCMLAIDPATRENGCIQFVPGSQKRGLVEHIKEDTGYGFGIYLPGYFNPRNDAVAVEMQPGDCVFFGALVIHGSDANKSDRGRRANTMAYTVTGDEPQRCRGVVRGRAL